jgi:hypothetical protein
MTSGSMIFTPLLKVVQSDRFETGKPKDRILMILFCKGTN